MSPGSLDKSLSTRKSEVAEVEAHLFENFDASFVTLSNIVKSEARNLTKEGKIKQSEVHNYTAEKAPHQELSVRSCQLMKATNCILI